MSEQATLEINAAEVAPSNDSQFYSWDGTDWIPIVAKPVPDWIILDVVEQCQVDESSP